MTDPGPRSPLPRTVRGWLTGYLCALPIAAVLAFSVGRSTTIPNEAALAHARFGWPFPWFTQDLSRYASIAYPTRMDVVGSRGNASGPIDESANLLLFGANTLIIGVLVFVIGGLALSLAQNLVLRHRERRA